MLDSLAAKHQHNKQKHSFGTHTGTSLTLVFAQRAGATVDTDLALKVFNLVVVLAAKHSLCMQVLWRNSEGTCNEHEATGT